MVPVLNRCGVKASVLGNHDLDHGVDVFDKLRRACNFPWLCANAVDPKTGAPLAGCQRTLLLPWRGITVGLVGLVEEEWLATLCSVDEDEVRYSDFVEEGSRAAAELRAQGAHLVIALTHMRMPNDERAAREIEGVDMVLGGHDHHYEVKSVNGRPVVKSGTDFRAWSAGLPARTRGRADGATVLMRDRGPHGDHCAVGSRSGREADVRLQGQPRHRRPAPTPGCSRSPLRRSVSALQATWSKTRRRQRWCTASSRRWQPRWRR